MEKKESFLSKVSFKCFEKTIYFLTGILFRPKVFFEKEDRRKVELSEPTIIISNHIAHIDGTIVSYVFRKYRLHNLAAKDRFEQGGFMGWYLTKAKCIPIDRQTLSTDWVRTSVRTLTADKENIAIYPEGRHGHNREILPFHSGVTTIAAMTGCQMVMVCLDGPYNIIRRSRLIVSEPFRLEPSTEGLTADYIGDQTEKLREKMIGLQSRLLAQ